MGGKQGGEGKGTHPPGPSTPPASSWFGKAGGGPGGKQQEGKGKKGDPGKGKGKSKTKGQDNTTNPESGGKPEQSAGQEKIDRVLALPGCAIYSLLTEMGGGILLTTPAPSLDDAYDESPELGIGRGVSRVEGTPPYTYGSLPGLQHAIKESKWLPYFHEELNLKPDDVPNHLLISYEMIPDHARPGFLMEILEITRDLEKKLAVVDWDPDKLDPLDKRIWDLEIWFFRDWDEVGVPWLFWKHGLQGTAPTHVSKGDEISAQDTKKDLPGEWISLIAAYKGIETPFDMCKTARPKQEIKPGCNQADQGESAPPWA